MHTEGPCTCSNVWDAQQHFHELASGDSSDACCSDGIDLDTFWHGEVVETWADEPEAVELGSWVIGVGTLVALATVATVREHTLPSHLGCTHQLHARPLVARASAGVARSPSSADELVFLLSAQQTHSPPTKPLVGVWWCMLMPLITACCLVGGRLCSKQGRARSTLRCTWPCSTWSSVRSCGSWQSRQALTLDRFVGHSCTSALR
jgi:hypothetical protein